MYEVIGTQFNKLRAPFSKKEELPWVGSEPRLSAFYIGASDLPTGTELPGKLGTLGGGGGGG